MEERLVNLSMQEIFDISANHLLEQDCKSINVSGENAYRGLFNMKCAIGIFIKDEEYKPEMEGCSVFGIFINSEFRNNHVEKFELLQKLQYIHDEYTITNWKKELKELASEYNLNFDLC